MVSLIVEISVELFNETQVLVLVNRFDHLICDAQSAIDLLDPESLIDEELQACPIQAELVQYVAIGHHVAQFGFHLLVVTDLAAVSWQHEVDLLSTHSHLDAFLAEEIVHEPCCDLGMHYLDLLSESTCVDFWQLPFWLWLLGLFNDVPFVIRGVLYIIKEPVLLIIGLIMDEPLKGTCR